MDDVQRRILHACVFGTVECVTSADVVSAYTHAVRSEWQGPAYGKALEADVVSTLTTCGRTATNAASYDAVAQSVDRCERAAKMGHVMLLYLYKRVAPDKRAWNVLLDIALKAFAETSGKAILDAFAAHVVESVNAKTRVRVTSSFERLFSFIVDADVLLPAILEDAFATRCTSFSEATQFWIEAEAVLKGNARPVSVARACACFAVEHACSDRAWDAARAAVSTKRALGSIGMLRSISESVRARIDDAAAQAASEVFHDAFSRGGIREAARVIAGVSTQAFCADALRRFMRGSHGDRITDELAEAVCSGYRSDLDVLLHASPDKDILAECVCKRVASLLLRDGKEALDDARRMTDTAATFAPVCVLNKMKTMMRETAAFTADIRVVTPSAWSVSPGPARVAWPHPIASAVRDASARYAAAYPHRTVDVHPTHGSCEIAFAHADEPVTVAPIQAAAMFVIADAGEASADDVAHTLSVGATMVADALETLADAPDAPLVVTLKDGVRMYALNPSAAGGKVYAFSASARSARAATALDRTAAVEAAIVRVVKSEKTIHVDTLKSHVQTRLAHIFHVPDNMFSASLHTLSAREYVECEGDTVRYLP